MEAGAPSLWLIDSGKSLPMFYPLWRQKRYLASRSFL
jgi:hypothetical protein